MKDLLMKKEIVLLLKPMTKTSQLNQENPRKMFQMRTQSQIAFQDVRLKVSLHDLCISARIAIFLNTKLCTI